MNDQRKVIYEQRRELMAMDDVEEVIKGMRDDCIQNMVYSIAPERTAPEDWDTEALHQGAIELLAIDVPFSSWVAEPGMTPDTMIKRLTEAGIKRVEHNFASVPTDLQKIIKKDILIGSIDACWKEHLQMLDFLKTSTGLRGYAQQNPLNAYKQEAFKLFEGMLYRVRERVTKITCYHQFSEELKSAATKKPTDSEKASGAPEKKPISRNAPCPCGSGKKYKHCCGKLS